MVVLAQSMPDLHHTEAAGIASASVVVVMVVMGRFKWPRSGKAQDKA